MNILFHRYTLHSRGALNAVSQRHEFHGALIRVDDGVGCLHPWPEFGDVPIEEQINLLREGGTSKVIERALHMAAADGAARRSGVNLFSGLEIPLSHYSWDHHQPLESQMRRVIGEGWRAIKMKGSAGFEETVTALEEVAGWIDQERDLPSPERKQAGSWQVPFLDAPPKFRVDFNSCLSGGSFANFLKQLPPHVRQRLDFIEDPFEYDAAAWSGLQRTHGIRLALDKRLPGATRGFDVAVMKPGRRESREIIRGLPPEVRVVMTSAMDHAIGQSFAAYEAAMAWRELGERMDLCGLCTEHLFEKDVFFERMSSHGGKLEIDRGTGLGFDEVLAKLPWEPL